MRILSITGQKPHSTGSGVFLTEVVNEWNRMGIKQAVVCGAYEEEQLVFPRGVDVSKVIFDSDALPFSIFGMSDEMPYKSRKYSEMDAEQETVYKERFLYAIQEAIEKFKPDVILCHHLYLLTAFVRERYPGHIVIGVSHGSDIRQIQKTPLRRDYICQQVKKLDGIFALHEAQKNKISEIFEYPAGKIEVTGIGYNQTIFNQNNKTRKPDKISLIFAGKLSEKKGVMSLLKSLNYVTYEKEKLLVKLAGGYGNEAEFKQIQELSEASPYEIIFLGMLSQDELAKEFQKSHVFVLPSFYEGLPLVIVEALACGLLVVATDLPGIQRWIRSSIKNAPVYFVEPPDREMEDEPVKEALGKFERELAKEIDWAINAQKNINVNLNLDALSWEGLAKKLYSNIRMLIEKNNK